MQGIPSIGIAKGLYLDVWRFFCQISIEVNTILVSGGFDTSREERAGLLNHRGTL